MTSTLTFRVQRPNRPASETDRAPRYLPISAPEAKRVSRTRVTWTRPDHGKPRKLESPPGHGTHPFASERAPTGNARGPPAQDARVEADTADHPARVRCRCSDKLGTGKLVRRAVGPRPRVLVTHPGALGPSHAGSTPEDGADAPVLSLRPDAARTGPGGVSHGRPTPPPVRDRLDKRTTVAAQRRTGARLAAPFDDLIALPTAPDAQPLVRRGGAPLLTGGVAWQRPPKQRPCCSRVRDQTHVAAS